MFPLVFGITGLIKYLFVDNETACILLTFYISLDICTN